MVFLIKKSINLIKSMTSSLNYTPSGVAGADHLKKAFGNRPQDQLVYQFRSNQAIKNLVKTILEIKKQESWNKKNFFACLQGLSDKRHQIAERIFKAQVIACVGGAQPTPNHFGIPRIQKPLNNYALFLGGGYKGHGDYLMEQFIEHLAANHEFLSLFQDSATKSFSSSLAGGGVTPIAIPLMSAGSASSLEEPQRLNFWVKCVITSLADKKTPPTKLFQSIEKAFPLAMTLRTPGFSNAEAPQIIKTLYALDGGIYQKIDPLVIFRKMHDKTTHSGDVFNLFKLEGGRIGVNSSFLSVLTQEQLGILIGRFRGLKAPTTGDIRTIISELAPGFLKENKAAYIDKIRELRRDEGFFRLWQEDKLEENFRNIDACFPLPGEKTQPAFIVREGVRNRRTAYVSFDLSARIGQKETDSLTRYTTWIDVQASDTPDSVFAKMRANSFIQLLHQDSFDVPKTLNKAEELFKQAVLWKPEESSLDDLVSKVGQLMFLLAHNHRDMRGTAATSEWLERALYQAHGFKMVASSNRMPDLIAFTHPFSFKSYQEAYEASFTLQAFE